MEGLIMAAQMLLGLSILVGIHEMGHMLVAKYFGMRVEKFSIGFPPKVIGFTKGETEYSLGAIPLGGFVKISGMVDESLDTKTLSEEPQPYEFRAKPAWQRLIVMMGGIIVNIIGGIIIFITLLYAYGEEYYSTSEVNKRGIVAYELGKKMGLQTGDKILKVNGKEFDKFLFGILSPDVLLAGNSYYTVERDGKVFDLPLHKELLGDLSKGQEDFIAPVYPFKVGKISKGGNAEKAGILEDDQIVSLNGKPINYFHELQETLLLYKGKKVKIKVLRSGKETDILTEVDPFGKIGFKPKILLNSSINKFSFGESVVKGTANAFSIITLNIKGLGKIFSGQVSARDSLSGPIGIAREFGGNWDWQRFWTLVGMLSMVLAFMNFLPIPALDGGHVVFLTYEMVSGRKPSDKFLENAQKVGMVILLSLMVFAFGNDILKIVNQYL